MSGGAEDKANAGFIEQAEGEGHEPRDKAHLKPCPFCGGEALEIEHPPHQHYFVPWPDHPGSWTIECVGCSVGMIASTKGEVEAAWNLRAREQCQHVTCEDVNRMLTFERDAERYRWLREIPRILLAEQFYGDRLDDEIDAAMR